jgi:predicted alpha/beta superfamily hydrolase
MKQTICIILVMFLAANTTAQQMKVIKDSLYSDNLKEERQIEVELPDDYDPASGKKYEVIYVTDGEWNNDIVAHMQRFVQIQFVPPCIVVSMKNMGVRDRDFTPSRLQGNPRSGGADKFLAFMKTELMPYIEKKYPARADNRVYVGSSLAGLFGMYAFLRDPLLFQSYLISDPAMWWDNGVLLKETGDKLAGMNNVHASLYITGREGEALREMGVYQLDSIFREKAPASLHWKVTPYAGETHNSMIFKTVFDGLKFTWAGYTTDLPRYHPMTGIVLHDKSFPLYIWPDERSDWHYTTDGTVPTAASPRITGKLDLTITEQFVIKSICVRDEYSDTLRGTFKVGNTLPAASLPKKVKSGGLDTLQGQLSGGIKIDTDGYYIFFVNTDGPVNISIGNVAFDKQSFIVPLQKGYYPLKVTYKGSAPGIEWVAPTSPDSGPVPATVLYHFK